MFFRLFCYNAGLLEKERFKMNERKNECINNKTQVLEKTILNDAKVRWLSNYQCYS